MHERTNAPLAPLTTLRLGGPAARLVEIDRTDDLIALLRGRDAAETMLLGGGSNVVVADEGFPGTVALVRTRGVSIERTAEGARVVADAGVVWDELVARAVDEGLSGVECLSGIPGSVGATPMQNVGAYGQEVADVVTRVHVLDRATGAADWVPAEACAFGYRTSRFRGSTRHAILAVEMRLPVDALSAPVRYAELSRALGVAEGERAPLAVVRETVVRLRRGKGMVVDASDPDSVSAGSFFVNPVLEAAELAALEARCPGEKVPRFVAAGDRAKVPAAWLIERAGFMKGFTKGRAAISSKHALALVNRGGATTRELLDLARAVRDGVRARFGVELGAEPVMIGCAL